MRSVLVSNCYNSRFNFVAREVMYLRNCNCNLLALLPRMKPLRLGCVSPTRMTNTRIIKDCNASKDWDTEGTKQGTLFSFVIMGYMLILL